MIIVTGGAGMIGSNIIRALNKNGITDILVVDNLEDGTRFSNLVDLDIADYWDQDIFLHHIIEKKLFFPVEAIFHQGACSDTMEWNGRFMMKNNFEFSKKLFHYCLEKSIPFIYASSAAVYGSRNSEFIEERKFERPLNVYGYSKMLFDHYVRRFLPDSRSPVCGLRYFNVYGPREKHKKSMASVAFHFNEQIKNGENLKLFEGSENFKRDFIYVDDVVAVNLWAWKNEISGIFNCGTGHAESFVAVADAVVNFHQKGKIEYCPFPEALKGRYQHFTQADLTSLRRAGYAQPFKNVEQGVGDYMHWLSENEKMIYTQRISSCSKAARE